MKEGVTQITCDLCGSYEFLRLGEKLSSIGFIEFTITSGQNKNDRSQICLICAEHIAGKLEEI